MEQGLVESQGNSLATRNEMTAPTIEAQDILIPKLRLLQPLSDEVGEGKGVAGDIIKSTTLEKMKTGDGVVEMIPLTFFKTWVIMRRKPTDTRGEFTGIEAYTPENCNATREWSMDGLRYERNLNLNFYCLVPSEIKRDHEALKKAMKSGNIPDSDDSMLPCLVSFQRTGYPAGKVLVTHFAKVDDFSHRLGKKIPPYGSVFKLGTEYVKGDKGNYYIFTCQKDRPATDIEKEACDRWLNILGKAAVRVDNSDFGEDEANPPHPADSGQGQRF